MQNTDPEVMRALGRIEGKQDTQIQSQIRLEGVLATHDRRLQHIEKWQSRLLGWGAGVAAVGVTIVAVMKVAGAGITKFLGI